MVLRLKNEDIKFFEAMVKRLGLYGQGMGKDKLSDMGTDYSTEKMTPDEVKDLIKVCKLLEIEVETSEHCEECYESMFDGYHYVNGERYCSTVCREKNYTDLEMNKRWSTDPDNHFYKAIL